MRISKWDDEHIWFEDGTTITYEYVQDCYECNYADFSILDIFYQGEEFNGIKIETIDELGFKLILLESEDWGFPHWTSKKIITIPCYSEQNGFYSTNLTIVITDPDGNKKKYDLECLWVDEDNWNKDPDISWEKESKEN